MIDQRPVLVLDGAAVAEFLHLALARGGWRTEAVGTLAEDLGQLEEHNPRIVMVDLGLPDGNGISERVLGYRLLPEQQGADQLVSSQRRKLLGASEGTASILAMRSKGCRLMH